jgi:AraC-like DNA-binding protein
MPTVVALQVQQLLERCERLGCDGAALRRAAGLSPAQLQDPEAQLPWRVAPRILLAAQRQTRDPLVGLRAGAAARPRGVLPYLFWSHASVKEGLEALASRIHYAAGPLRASLAEVAGHAQLSVELDDAAGPRDGLALAREYAITFLLAILREALGAQFTASDVCFPHAPRGLAAEYARVLGAPASFRHSLCAIRFPAALLARPVPTANPVVARDLAARIDRAATGAAFGARVERAIEQLVLERRPTDRREAARRLGVSVRTLQRRLDSEQRAFRELRDAVLRQIACQQLAGSELPIAAIAEQLGFGEASAFGRAFRRWTGTSASAYRAAAREPE